MAVRVDQFMCRSDNFGVLVHDEASGRTLLIDAPEEAPILAAIERTGWKPDLLLITHHHGDHVEANLALKQKFGLTIIGPAREAAKIPGIDQSVGEGDAIPFGRETISVLETPGHTAGHISYFFPSDKLAFVGDTLFSIGCGRVIEGTPEMMWESLLKLRALPDDTRIYCGHEYTKANIRFAKTIEPGNSALNAREAEVEKLLAAHKPTIPSTIGEEKKANPFLRADVPEVAKSVGLAGSPAWKVFAEIRERKNRS